MNYLLEAILTAIGVTFIVTESSLFDRFKVYNRFSFLECPICVGFHMGYLFYFLWNLPIMMDLTYFLHAFLSGVVTSIGSMMVVKALEE